MNDVRIIEVKVNPKDIDTVRVGATARVRLTAFNQRETPQIDGKVIQVSADAIVDPQTGMSSYNATKAAVVAVSETLGFELDPWGIKVSVVCPSFFRTNLHESMRGTDTAMESTAIGLITQAPFTAAEIATAVLHGIEAGDAVIVPDDIAVSMVAMKRTDPEAYAVWGRDGAARLARRELGG